MGGTKQCCDSRNIINARLEMWTCGPHCCPAHWPNVPFSSLPPISQALDIYAIINTCYSHPIASLET